MSRYLAIEGGDGVGKTTVVVALAKLIEATGAEVVTVREPGGTPMGEKVRLMLLESDDLGDWSEALLFAAQRAELARLVITPALDRGAWVVSDRSYYSSLAYQGHARGLGVEEVRRINELALGGTIPNRVVVLVAPAALALARQEMPDRIGGAGLEFQDRVLEGYRILAAEEPERVLLVDVGTQPEDTAAAILERIGLT